MSRILSALLALILCASVQAEGIRSTIAVPNRTAYWSDTSVAVGVSAEVVDFTSATGAGDGGTFRVCVWNRDGSNDLMVRFYPAGASLPSEGASEQTTPSNDAVSEVQVIAPHAAATPGPVCFEGAFEGAVFQSRTSAVSAYIRITY